MSADINHLAWEIKSQADRLFPERTDTSMFLKLYGEVGEMVQSGNPEEVADVLIMVLDYASRHRVDIEKEIRAKMEINEFRDWKINPLGVAQHVK